MARLNSHPHLKRFLDYIIMNQRDARPRWYIRMMAPLYQHRARTSKIYRSVRMDTPPYRRFSLGAHSVIESWCCINNAVGDIIIGDHTRVGLHSTIIGPVTIGSHCGTSQGSIITALIHPYTNSDENILDQKVQVKPIVIEDDVIIGANASVMPGVTVGTHSIVGAGAVVTHDVPPHTIVAGVPAKVIKHI